MYEALSTAAIFQGVSTDSVLAIIDQLHTVNFTRGQRVFQEGEPGDRLYIVLSGMVKIGRATTDGRESLLTILGPSDVFGELSVFDPGPRTSTVTALTDVDTVSMSRGVMQEWITTEPFIAEQLLRVLARRLRRTNDYLTDMIFVDVPGRVAKQLLLLAQRFGTSTPEGLMVEHELTQGELAQLVGAARESVNKALVDFERRQWIRATGRTVLITDPERLARRAGSGTVPLASAGSRP